MITLGFDNWDRGLSGHGNRGHRKMHDYHYYPRRTDERHYEHGHHYDRNAFLNINHVWNTYDDNNETGGNGHWSNFVQPPGHGAPGYSGGNGSRIYSGKREDNRLVGDFRKNQGHVLYNGPGKPQKVSSDNVPGNHS